MISLLTSNSPGAFTMKSRRSKRPEAARRCTNDSKPQVDLGGSGAHDPAVFRGLFCRICSQPVLGCVAGSCRADAEMQSRLAQLCSQRGCFLRCIINT